MKQIFSAVASYETIYRNESKVVANNDLIYILAWIYTELSVCSCGFDGSEVTPSHRSSRRLSRRCRKGWRRITGTSRNTDGKGYVGLKRKWHLSQMDCRMDGGRIDRESQCSLLYWGESDSNIASRWVHRESIWCSYWAATTIKEKKLDLSESHITSRWIHRESNCVIRSLGKTLN